MAFRLDRERLVVYPRLFAALYAGIGGWWWASGAGLLDRSGKNIGVDFVAFYAASKLAHQGRAVDVWEVPAITAMERLVIGAPINPCAFHYPPSAVLLLLPFATLPYLWAFAAWVALGLGLYVSWQRRILRDPAGLGLALAFPGVFQNVFQGQNGLFTTSILGLALCLLDARPALAGVLIGLLTAKPPLAGAAFLALIAGKRWRALGAALASAGGLVLVSAGLFGPEVWRAFFANAAFAVQVLETPKVLPWARMPTVEVAALLVGAPVAFARLAQGLAAVGAAAAVVVAWSRPLSEAARVSVLVGATFLITPFAFDYDTALLALPAAWLGRDWLLPEGGLRGEGLLVVMLWLAPLLVPAIAMGTHIQLGPVLSVWLIAAAFRRG